MVVFFEGLLFCKGIAYPHKTIALTSCWKNKHYIIQHSWFTCKCLPIMLVRTTNVYLVLVSLALLLAACGETAPKNPNPDTAIAVEEPTPVNTNAESSPQNQYVIKGDGFYGLLSGVPFVERAERLEKGVLSDGEGDFEVYYIKGVEGERIGYILPHSQDEKLIGSITITTPIAKTEDGIGIGSTFAELRAQTPDIQVYGSEIESRTHAVRGREMFLLDMYETTYELEEDKIEPNTVIKQITILEHQAG